MKKGVACRDPTVLACARVLMKGVAFGEEHCDSTPRANFLTLFVCENNRNHLQE